MIHQSDEGTPVVTRMCWWRISWSTYLHGGNTEFASYCFDSASFWEQLCRVQTKKPIWRRELKRFCPTWSVEEAGRDRCEARRKQPEKRQPCSAESQPRPGGAAQVLHANVSLIYRLINILEQRTSFTVKAFTAAGKCGLYVNILQQLPGGVVMYLTDT